MPATPSPTGPSVQQSASATPPGNTTPAATATLASCPGPVGFASLTVLVHVSGADDLAIAPDGTLWVSDPAGGRLVHLDNAGTTPAVFANAGTPEGIVVLATDQLALAEQGPDRVAVVQPSSSHQSTLLQLSPRAGLMGLDGIATGAAVGTLLIPDSANGALLSVTLGGAAQTLASGLGRPVGAAALPGGDVVVAAEGSTGLFRVPAGGGHAVPLGSVSIADDVISVGSLLYVTSLGTHQLLAVDPGTGRSRVLVSGIDMPQGVAQLPDGRLAVADSTSGAIAVTPPC